MVFWIPSESLICFSSLRSVPNIILAKNITPIRDFPLPDPTSTQTKHSSVKHSLSTLLTTETSTKIFTSKVEEIITETSTSLGVVTSTVIETSNEIDYSTDILLATITADNIYMVYTTQTVTATSTTVTKSNIRNFWFVPIMHGIVLVEPYWFAGIWHPLHRIFFFFFFFQNALPDRGDWIFLYYCCNFWRILIFIMQYIN